MFRTFLLAACVASGLLTGCSADWIPVDVDDDGVPYGQDCDDSDPDVSPDTPEIWYDGIDQNCDGNDADQDGDGFVAMGFEPNDDLGQLPNDCYDGEAELTAAYTVVSGEGFDSLTAADINPAAGDTWYDGVDQDCGGEDDFDQDGDGYRSADAPDQDGQYGDDCVDGHPDDDLAWGGDTETARCTAKQEGDEQVPVTDLGFTAAEINPGATDSPYDGVDQDCDGTSDFDSDGDDYDRCVECDDEDPEIYPNDSVDTWYDCVDSNCDGNDGDKDGDTYVSYEYTQICDNWDEFSGHETDTTNGFDCWDDYNESPTDYTPLNGFPSIDSADINPAATDIPYDGIDADCQSDSDFDKDGDGYDTTDYDQRDGSTGDDCEDDPDTTSYAADVNPGALESCDTAYDDDCDGDDNDPNAENCENYWYDGDNDGYGDIDSATACYCEPRTDNGYTSQSKDDCDDSESTTYPGASETVADSVDQDCDGGDTCYEDLDGDDYGTTSTVTSSDLDCVDSGESPVSTDCKDTGTAAEDTYPGAAENDSSSSCMSDVDGDGYGDDSPSSGVSAGTDCDDAENTTYPGASEVTADGVDQDCDSGDTCYRDTDGDTYGTSATVDSSDLDCTGSGEADNDDDCAGSNANAYPGAAYNESSTSCREDADGDGYGDSNAPSGVTDGTDCDDSDSSINTAATEGVADGVDQDCDSQELCYDDSDRDGYGDSSTTTSADLDCTDTGESSLSTDCDNSDEDTFPGAAPNDSASSCMTDADGDDYGDDSPASGVTAGTDCDDGDNDAYPGASEDVADGVDQDCDGGDTCYVDSDGDDYGSSSTVDSSDLDCTDSGEADNDDDCATSNANAFPGAAPNDSSTLCMEDADGDDWGDSSAPSGVTDGTDCDDGDNTIYPNATEVVADGVDDDCDGGDSCYEDNDGDDYGSSSTVDSSDLDCTDSGEADNSDDCRDSGSGAFYSYPGAAENDSTTACMEDIDGDGYGDSSAPSGVTDGTDCDDGDATINTAATEGVADGVDQDCDNSELCYVDSDGDGYGDSSTTSSSNLSCTDSGEADNDDDCLDSGTNDSDTYPGAAYNESGSLCMADADGDGYGDDSAPSGVTDGTDCDDGDSGRNPGETEVCDGSDKDEDCDSLADDNDPEGADGTTTYYYDDDTDGYGDADTSAEYCDPPTDWITDDTDCDDTQGSINPGASETCDTVDNDCDDMADEDDGSGGTCFSGGELMISEVLYDSESSTDKWGEWFEVTNTTGSDINTFGMLFYSSSNSGREFVVGTELVVSAGGTAVFCFDDDGSLVDGGDYQGDQACDYIYGSTQGYSSEVGQTFASAWQLSNSSSNTIEITLGSGGTAVTLDSVAYEGGGGSGWPAASSGESIELSATVLGSSPAEGDNDAGADWCVGTNNYYHFGVDWEYGTPNAVNDCP